MKFLITLLLSATMCFGQHVNLKISDETYIYFTQQFEEIKRADSTLSGKVELEFFFVDNEVDTILYESDWSNPRLGSLMDSTIGWYISLTTFNLKDSLEDSTSFKVCVTF